MLQGCCWTTVFPTIKFGCLDCPLPSIPSQFLEFLEVYKTLFQVTNKFWINTVYKAFCSVKEEMNQVVNTILQIKTKITKIQKALKRILKMAQILDRQKTVVVKNINTCFLLGTVRIPALLLNLRLSPRAMLLTSISNKLKIVAWMFFFPVVWSKTKNFNVEIFIFYIWKWYNE